MDGSKCLYAMSIQIFNQSDHVFDVYKCSTVLELALLISANQSGKVDPRLSDVVFYSINDVRRTGGKEIHFASRRLIYLPWISIS